MFGHIGMSAPLDINSNEMEKEKHGREVPMLKFRSQNVSIINQDQCGRILKVRIQKVQMISLNTKTSNTIISAQITLSSSMKSL